ncbi:molybdenum ABC transporter ATP-binding protein [Sneathiella sp.]|uniref:molybdenum ABC transporter ATP-binding protein n=1 Tax=Sneathiella sp. TaxID=1964365 RepID=UPI002FE1A4B3
MLDVCLTKKLGDFRLEAAFKAPAGVTAIFGPSGAGKTLIAKMIAGLTRPDAGHVRLGDQALFDAAAGVDIPPERRGIGFIFQEHRLFPHYSVRGNLAYGAGRRGDGESRVAFDKVVDILGLAALLERRPRDLSGGERQRVAIGRAILSNPEMLIMDEPLSSLDDARKAEILPLIETLTSEFGLPTLYISHSIEEIARLAETLVLMDRGAMKAAGPARELLSRLDLIRYTGGDDAGTIIEATVRAYDPAHSLLEVETETGSRLYLTGAEMAAGATLRLRIRARDIALASAPPKELSILNYFEGAIRDHCTGAQGMEEVLLDVGFPLAARITRRSFEAMALKKGSRVYALVKSVTLSRL